MAIEREKVAKNQMLKAELRIEEITGPGRSIVRLQGVTGAIAPRVGEKVELMDAKFKVVEVSHGFSGSPLKQVVVVTVEKPQATAAQ